LFYRGDFPEYEEDSDGERHLLQSMNSSRQVHLRFINATSQSVDIFWINYEGQALYYKTLKKSEYVDLNTYCTHPWVFKDSVFGERYVVQNKTVFVCNINARLPENRRLCFRIRQPLRNLMGNSLLQIAHSLRSAEAIEKLEIPELLKVELRKLMDRKKFISVSS
jgi:von Hippel-Lindau disease tumor supressor